MKAKLACVACMLILATQAAYADDESTFAINISPGNMGFGGLFPLVSGDTASELSVTLLPVGIEFRRTNLGLWFSPFHYSRLAFPNETTVTRTSFINFGIYWNVLASWMHFGPFASVNYFFLDNGVRWSSYIFSAGLQGGLRIRTDEVNWPLLTAEAGFRIIDGSGHAFATVKVDFMPLAAGVILLLAAIISLGASSDDS